MNDVWLSRLHGRLLKWFLFTPSFRRRQSIISNSSMKLIHQSFPLPEFPFNTLCSPFAHNVKFERSPFGALYFFQSLAAGSEHMRARLIKLFIGSVSRLLLTAIHATVPHIVAYSISFRMKWIPECNFALWETKIANTCLSRGTCIGDTTADQSFRGYFRIFSIDWEHMYLQQKSSASILRIELIHVCAV